MTEHSRFLNIERARADEEAPDETADRARIAAVVEAAPASRVDGGAPRDRTEAQVSAAIEIAPPLAPFSTGAVVRSEGGGQEIEDDVPALPIDVDTVQGQPFVRCGRCGRDNTIHAERCDDCGAELDTVAQRAFNEKLWNAQRASADKQRQALAAMASRRQEERRNTARPLPPPGMLPPPELTRPMDPSDGPYLMELLRLLKHKRWQVAVAAAMVVLPFFLVTLGGTALSWVGRVLLLLLALGMLPRRLARRLVEWWYGVTGRG